MKIIAHRGNMHGPDPRTENSLATLTACLHKGWGIETDIRLVGDTFIISHDPAPVTSDNRADALLAVLRELDEPLVALNVKELGYEKQLIDYLADAQVLDKLFLFDMELIEAEPGSTARLFRQLSAEVPLAARVSDRNEPVARALAISEASVCWVDEFDSLWVQKETIKTLQDGGLTAYAISPELHGFSREIMFERWAQFSAWGVAGVCTDHPAELQAFLTDKD